MNRYAERVAELTGNNTYLLENNKKIQPLSEAELQEAEQELGHSLPEDYREFVRDYNGLRLANNECRRAALYHLHDYMWGRASIAGFAGIREAVKFHQRNTGYAPPELMELGWNETVQLFIAVTGEHRGSVYQFYPRYFPETLAYYPELELVARSFDDFIHMLKPKEEGLYHDSEEMKQEIAAVMQRLQQIELHADNHYTPLMNKLKGRYVYSTLGEDAKALSEADLQNVEQEIGYALPEDYREFLSHYGGYAFLPLPMGDFYMMGRAASGSYSGMNSLIYGACGARVFHGVMNNDYHDLTTHYHRLKNFLPPSLPIANNGSLCIALEGSNAGAIYYVGEKATEFSLCPSYGGQTMVRPEDIHFVAASFDKYMQSLSPK